MDFIKRASYWFILITILLFPFQYHLFHLHTQVINSLFSTMISHLTQWIGWNPYFSDLSSDSKNLFVFVGFLAICSTLLSILGIFKKHLSTEKLGEITRTFARIFLTLILFKYGLDKIFKQQFPVPEANLLFTPLGKLDKDILYWSTIGSSSGYNLFLGFAETMAGLFLFFKKTSQLGAIMAFFILVNVFAVNLSFDISVKLFSGLLLLMSLFLAQPHLYALISTGNTSNQKSAGFKELKWNMTAKIISGFFILAEGFYPYFKLGTFNDDLQNQQPLYGAYELVNDSSNYQIKRFFLHKDDYLIFQDENDEMSSYKIDHNLIHRYFLVDNTTTSQLKFHYQYDQKEKLFTLSGIADQPLRFRKIEEKELPLLQPLFHLTVD
jgi:hypothetical protein